MNYAVSIMKSVVVAGFFGLSLERKELSLTQHNVIHSKGATYDKHFLGWHDFLITLMKYRSTP